MKKTNIVFPDYNHSILNLINSILKHYNVKTKYNGLQQLDKVLEKNYKNIVLIILDGMGKHILDQVSPNGFLEKNCIDTITSVCPSTTTAAMTTYYSGKPPIETGWIAMSQYFKEYGRAIEMLRKIDSYTAETIKNARMDVFNLMKYETTYEQIEKASTEVKAYEINPTFCDARSKRNIKADNIEILCDAIKSICTNKDKNFILAYNDNPDAFLHKYGCESNEVKTFITNAEKQIEKLTKELEDTETLIIISADHGHKDIEKIYSILELNDIQDCLIMPASLESRAITFWVKEDKKEKFENIFKTKYKDEFILYKKEDFLNKNLLGFVGNYIAISIGSSIIKLETNIGKEKKNKKSTHCGFTPNEMEVPLIIIK